MLVRLAFLVPLLVAVFVLHVSGTALVVIRIVRIVMIGLAVVIVAGLRARRAPARSRGLSWPRSARPPETNEQDCALREVASWYSPIPRLEFGWTRPPDPAARHWKLRLTLETTTGNYLSFWKLA
jgi:hypothetical protein